MGVVAINKRLGGEKQKTVIVLGVARSGTSMVVPVLERLGVSMGSNKNDIDFEDEDVFQALETPTHSGQFARLVAERNRQHRLWGWKRPDSINYLKRFIKCVSNPHFIIMFRDPVAIAIRNQMSVKTDFIDNLVDTHRRYAKVIKFIRKTRYPCLLISYEKAVLKKDYFVHSLCDFLDITPDPGRIGEAVKAINPERQKYISAARQHEIRGFVHPELEQEHLLCGWAQKLSSSEPVWVDILIDGERVESTLANKFRKDLQEAGIGTGHHAFAVDIGAYLDGVESHEVTVITQEDEVELVNSPFLLPCEQAPQGSRASAPPLGS